MNVQNVAHRLGWFGPLQDEANAGGVTQPEAVTTIISTNKQAPAPEPNAESGEKGETDDDADLTDKMKQRIAKLRQKEVDPLKQQVADLQAQIDKMNGERDSTAEAQAEASPPVAQSSTPAKEPTAADAMAEVLRLRTAVNQGFGPDEAALLTATTQADLDRQVAAIKKLRGERVRSSGATSPIPAAGDTPAVRTHSRKDLLNSEYYRAHEDDINKAINEGRIVD